MSFESLRPYWNRKTPLKTKTPLKRKTPLSPISKNKEKRSKRFVPKAILKAIEERSGGYCERMFNERRCPESALPQPHHIKPRSQGGKHEISNLMAVCFECHIWIHANPREAKEQGLLK
jgi:5-methylcytosine-specific restriction endonuclease McrA